MWLGEGRNKVRVHFADLGVAGDEEIYLHCAAAPRDGVSDLVQLVKDYKPALVIRSPGHLTDMLDRIRSSAVQSDGNQCPVGQRTCDGNGH
jgi:hypothetical protein